MNDGIDLQAHTPWEKPATNHRRRLTDLIQIENTVKERVIILPYAQKPFYL
jgi:hypothetical protein